VVISTVCLTWILFWLLWGIYTRRDLVNRLFLLTLYCGTYLYSKELYLYNDWRSWFQSWHGVFTLSTCRGYKSRSSPPVVPVTSDPPLALPEPAPLALPPPSPPSPNPSPKELDLSQLFHWPRLTKAWVEDEVCEIVNYIFLMIPWRS
jgi:hypothetical protein